MSRKDRLFGVLMAAVVTRSLRWKGSQILRLEPERHEAPLCQDYGDLDAVVVFEQEMRVHRAHVEAFEITAMDGQVEGSWKVASTSGRPYLVDLVDGSHDTCTCPDFLGNGLGTCKHLEAVRRLIQASPVLDKAYHKLFNGPSLSTLSLDASEGMRLKVLGPWTKELLAFFGLQRRRADQAWEWEGAIQLRGGFLTGPELPQPVRWVHALPHVLESRRYHLQSQKRSEFLLQAFARDQACVDLLNHPLFPYQREGVKHLVAQGRALLADDMGLGKTVQAIAACEVLLARGEASRILIVTPASLKHQWAREIERYTPRKAAVLDGKSAFRAAALESDLPYKILSYELTWRELPRLKNLGADVLILDEAQRAKNFRTRTAATLRDIPSRFLFVLTGTPVENRLDDLYSLLQMIDPEILGPLWKFNLDFHQQGNRGKVLGCKNLSQLRERISRVVLRRRKEDVLSQLPPLTEQTRYTALTQEQADYEAGCRSEASRYMALAEKRPLTLREQKALQAALLKARQACNALELADPKCLHPASPKLDEFQSLVADIAAQGGSKILVFSEWVEMLKLAGARLDQLGLGWSMLSGSVPSEARPGLLDRFRQDPDQMVLLSSDAGGVGLNLQVASYIIHLDLPWNPARLDQRTSRAHRLGQTRGVSVHYLVSETGLERGIEGTLAGKRAVRSAALDPDSQVDELENQSFSLFLRHLQETMKILDRSLTLSEAAERLEAEVGQASEEDGQVPEVEAYSQELSSCHTSEEEAARETPVPSLDAKPLSEPIPPETLSHRQSPISVTQSHARSRDRLRLAQVVLAAGFPADAVKAAYEALTASISGLLETPTQGHSALVALIYRDLIPTGRLPLGVPTTLARLHDLSALDSFGVPVDSTLAQECVLEAERWLERLEAKPSENPPTGAHIDEGRFPEEGP